MENIPTPGDAGAGNAFGLAIEQIYKRAFTKSDDTFLLVRELLDNRDRAAAAGNWYLRPFLEGLAGLLRLEPGWESAEDAVVATHIYQILGAINYFAISSVTLENMFSKQHLKDMRSCFATQLNTLTLLRPTG